MKNIERLRELANKPESIDRHAFNLAIVACGPALLAVVEAAEKVRLAFTEDADGELRFVGLDRATQSIREVNAALRAMEGEG